ncbi:RNA-binding protein 34 [Brachyhypopomus gauderio]|uniref:RNA-binding protein 34 n=1 Tax=Brachyhypopomus gauderio TaxID=698409 RepID=UPI0040415245
MKKHGAKREVAKCHAVQAKGYVVGMVSSSLCAEQTTPASDALSSLFSATSSRSTLVFVSAPKTKPKTSQIKQAAGHAPRNEPIKQKTITKEKSRDEKILQNREEALKNADDEDVEKIPRKVKRKAQQLDIREKLEEEYPGRKRKAAKNFVEERLKLKRTVFVGNLPATLKKEDLKRIFKDLGDIESVRFRSVVREDPSMSRKLATIQRKVDPKKQSVNAYVVFKNEEGAVNAMTRNGMEIETDVYIRVDRVSKKASHDHKRSIFVGNLPYDINELHVRKHFEDCGKVGGVRLVRDRNSGLGKGFGYVLFENTDSVMLALKMNGSQLLDRKIRVKRSVKKEKEKSTGPVGKGAGSSKGSQNRHFKGSKHAANSTAKGRPLKNPPRTANKTSTSFTGEMADPNAKVGQRLKKKFKPKKKSKAVNI